MQCFHLKQTWPKHVLGLIFRLQVASIFFCSNFWWNEVLSDQTASLELTSCFHLTQNRKGSHDLTWVKLARQCVGLIDLFALKLICPVGSAVHPLDMDVDGPFVPVSMSPEQAFNYHSIVLHGLDVKNGSLLFYLHISNQSRNKSRRIQTNSKTFVSYKC